MVNNDRDIYHILKQQVTKIFNASSDKYPIYLDFDNISHIKHPGNNYNSYCCPACLNTSTDLYWNVATFYALQYKMNHDQIIRIQNVENSSTLFSCAFCLEEFTAADLGIVPVGYKRINCIQAIDLIKNHEHCFIRLEDDSTIHNVYSLSEDLVSDIKKFYDANFFVLSRTESTVHQFDSDKNDYTILSDLIASFVSYDIFTDEGRKVFHEYTLADYNFINSEEAFNQIAHRVSQKFGSPIITKYVFESISKYYDTRLNAYFITFSELIDFFLYEIYNHDRYLTYTEWFYNTYKDDIDDGLDMDIMNMPEIIDNYKAYCEVAGSKPYVDVKL